jgi:hypothetical protein
MPLVMVGTIKPYSDNLRNKALFKSSRKRKTTVPFGRGWNA